MIYSRSVPFDSLLDQSTAGKHHRSADDHPIGLFRAVKVFDLLGSDGIRALTAHGHEQEQITDGAARSRKPVHRSDHHRTGHGNQHKKDLASVGPVLQKNRAEKHGDNGNARKQRTALRCVGKPHAQGFHNKIQYRLKQAQEKERPKVFSPQIDFHDTQKRAERHRSKSDNTAPGKKRKHRYGIDAHLDENKTQSENDFAAYGNKQRPLFSAHVTPAFSQ